MNYSKNTSVAWKKTRGIGLARGVVHEDHSDEGYLLVKYMVFQGTGSTKIVKVPLERIYTEGILC